jgi:fatty acid-binding protein DegV
MFSGLFGKLLDIKPVVQLENGILTPVDNPKGKSTAIENMFRIIRATTPEYRRGIEIWVGHSASILDAKYVRRQLSKIFKIQEKKIPLVEAGPTIVSHTGPGVVCVSIIPK